MHRAWNRKTGKDYTDQMLSWARKRVVELEGENLCGLKTPAHCGMERVKVYVVKGAPVRKGIGMFARVFMEHIPPPVEEEGRSRC